MLDDGSDELINGLWPFMKRALLLFLPFWVYLFCWTAGIPLLISAILSGISLSGIIYFEKIKLKQKNKDNVNK
ncbi:MAG: hypothetical protein QF885_00940 [Candidatus Thalassarchaeaceae archaeon]|jgi:hypothetical protein|nr:hypothetical protein [Candidatus Thalassarchaeaceae archaeon]|tara:strand:+ start:48 stop:266 length:219 start_codon:yes stop_codon:yes gene_type:complete